MDVSLKDQAFGVIQRDRLSEFFKQADENKTGCFYFSLMNAYHQLNPGKLLPRNFESEVLKRNPDLSFDQKKTYDRFSELHDLLHLELDKILILSPSKDDEKNLRQVWKIPENIGIENSKSISLTSEPNRAALLLWLSADKVHVSSVGPAKVQWNIMGGVSSYRGGPLEINGAIAEGLRPKLIFLLKKSE